MKRVLLGTPVYGSIHHECLNGLMDTALNSEVAEFVIRVVRGTYVNVNRNRIVDAAKDEKCDDVLMVDSDMAVTRAHIERLLSHDVDIVGAVYCKRVEGPTEWLFHCNEGATPDERGLLPVNDIGTGVTRISMRVFEAIEKRFPERAYQHKGRPVRHEYFPIGVYHGEFLGEDVFFCRLAKECGFDIWADTQVVIGHIGTATFPLKQP